MTLSSALISGCAHHARSEIESGFSGTVLNAAIDIYQGPLNHLSAVRHGQCPMYPSCSQFSREVMAKHGAVLGWVMTMDRLMRCGRSELSTAPLIQINGQWRYYDPVHENDFWWNSKKSPATD
jgi:putative component of membrane protein insertase Oxa1/YidC/SpoIIIJ protein YidD